MRLFITKKTLFNLPFVLFFKDNTSFSFMSFNSLQYNMNCIFDWSIRSKSSTMRLANFHCNLFGRNIIIFNPQSKNCYFKFCLRTKLVIMIKSWLNLC